MLNWAFREFSLDFPPPMFMLLIGVIFASVTKVVAQASGTISITDAPYFEEQRDCVRYCLAGGRNEIDYFFSCNHRNSCYCRSDLSPLITSYLSAQLSEYCTPGSPENDISAAISIYSGYCATALGNAAPTQQSSASSATAMNGATTSQPPMTSSSDGSTNPSTTYEITTVTASSDGQSLQSSTSTITTLSSSRSNPGIQTIKTTVTVTPSQAASKSDIGSNLDAGQISGIVIAVVGLILTGLGVLLGYKTYLRHKNKKQQESEPFSTTHVMRFR